VSTITTPLLCYPGLSRRLEISVPGHSPSQATNALLTTSLNQQSQTLLHSRALGACSTAAHRLSHQAIVDIDVRPHDSLLMCNIERFVCISQSSGAVNRTFLQAKP